MGLFDRFKKDNSNPKLGSEGPFAGLLQVEAEVIEGQIDLDVVGESFYQEALWFVIGGTTKERVRTPIVALLVPEPENQYDLNAIAVYIKGLKVGHLGKDDAEKMISGLNALITQYPGKFIALNGVVAGGGMRSDGLGRLGVFLNYSPAEFGLKVVQGRRLEDPVALTMGTGESYAQRTDAADDSYDLSWIDSLGSDGPKALKKLRELAASNQEPVSRHFIFSRLEDLLYGYRDTLPDALVEYDQWAEEHHQELVSGMRSVLIEKFGSLPRLDTYKQSAIRHTKVKDYEAAALWCDRGIDVYGVDAFKDEWVVDLEKRSAQAHDRLAKTSVSNTAAVALTEVLVCETCSNSFERVRTRGVKPVACADCLTV